MSLFLPLLKGLSQPASSSPSQFDEDAVIKKLGIYPSQVLIKNGMGLLCPQSDAPICACNKL